MHAFYAISLLAIALTLQASAAPRQVATYVASTNSVAAASSQSVTFGRSPVKLGQQVDQTVWIELSLKTSSRQGAQVLEQVQSTIARERRRVITTAAVEEGVPVAAYVSYPKSESSKDDRAAVPDPIAGKTYLCRRKGEKLQVFTRDGNIPPQAEFKLVAENMEVLGQENPLAAFLAGKQLSVGQQVALPAKVAKRLLGLNSQLGEVTRFELTLEEVRHVGGGRVAAFRADIEAQRSDSSQMRLMIGGPMVIDAATCRAISSELSGPIGMSHSSADPRGRMQMDSTGRIAMRVKSHYKTRESRE